MCTCPAVCAWGSPAAARRGAAIAGAAQLELPAARHGFLGRPCCITETPGKTLLPVGASAGKGDGSARLAPSCPPASPARQRVAGGCQGLPGWRGSHLRAAAAEGLSAGSAVLMSLRILFILYRALFDV